MATVQLEGVTRIYSEPARARSGSVIKALGRRIFGLNHDLVERDEGEARLRQGPVVALDHLDLTVPDGKTVSVVGPSGCGKTTLLRVVAGLDTDYTGRVLYDGVEMQNVPPKERYIGMVFEDYALYPNFTSEGNLSFFFEVRGTPDEKTERRIRITSELMGIGFDELLKRKPGTLSSGQQQRVAVARAIARKPRLFLFDEPLSNLDAKLRVRTRGEIKKLLRRFQITAIYVTHDQTEAIVLGDQLAVMRAGKIEQVGTYRGLRHNPVNAFVAGFLGLPPMNLLAGTVEDGNLRLDDVAVPLPQSVKERVDTLTKVSQIQVDL